MTTIEDSEVVESYENLVKQIKEEKLPEFKFGGYIKASNGKPIYGIEFCNCLRSDAPVIFATVGSNNATIFECKNDKMEILQIYSDPDPEETFYTCCWTYSPNALHAILVFGGSHGIIRLIHQTSSLNSQILIGHKSAIHDLKVHPKDCSILLSASGDRTLRLWNIESEICIAIFGGFNGHTDQIVSADFDAAGSKIVSGGGDYQIKIWNLDVWPINKLIESSFSASLGSDRPFRNVTVHYANFTTRQIHHNLVDCVKWFGSCIFSKATENEIICWAPITSTGTVIHRFEVNNCDYWYIRFAIDSSGKCMAIGNNVGHIYVWSLNNEDPTRRTILRHKKCKSTIRQTAFSPDGKILMAVADDSTIFRWIMK